jgi:hypothetical protein
MDGAILSEIYEVYRDYAEDKRNGRPWRHVYHRVLDIMCNTPALAIIESKLRGDMTDGPILFSFSKIFFNQDCSDIRDRIYAALPLLTQYNSEDAPIAPDYSLTVPKLFEAIYERFSDEDFFRSRSWLSSKMFLIRETLELDRNDETVKRVFAKIWKLPVPHQEWYSPEELLFEMQREEKRRPFEEKRWSTRLLRGSIPLQMHWPDGGIEDLWDWPAPPDEPE